MPNRFVQQNTRPAGPQCDVHDTGGCRNGVQIDQSDAQSLAGGGLPVFGVDQPGQRVPPATASGPAFTATAIFDDDRNVQPGHRARVGHRMALGPQDHHFL